MSTTHPDGAESSWFTPTWTYGQSAAETPIPRYETKPTSTYADGRVDTGGGYCRIRSYEYRPETPGDGKEDVYASVHRLCAVAWCYPSDMPIADVLADLDGKDVHHNTPEASGERGVEWDNRECTLNVLDHGRHASVTQSQVRAWGEDAKRTVETDEPEQTGRCGRCEATDTVLVRSDDFDGVRCVECSQIDSDGSPMEVVS